MCRSILVQARTDASFVRETGDGRLMRVPAYFATPPVVVIKDGQGYDIDALQANLDHKVEQWNKRGSNFNIERVSRFVLSILDTPVWTTARLHVRSHAGLFGEEIMFSQCPKQRWKMLRLERVVGVISTHPSPTSFDKLHRLWTLSKPRGVDFPCPNKTNPPFRKTQPLHIHQRFGLRRE